MLCCGLLLPVLLLSEAGAATFSESVRSGAGMLRDGRFEEAAESFSAALESEPSSEPARKGLAASWAGLGTAHLRAGRLRDGRAALEKAVEVRPESTEYHRLLAQTFFNLGDLRSSRREANLALKLSPDDAAARALSGDLYYSEGRLNLAVGEWETAASGGAHGLAAKIERGRRDMKAEEGMARETSRYFAVRYDRDVPRELVRDFFKLLDRAFDLLHDQLGDYPRDEIQVILYSWGSFSDVTQAAAWVGGLYDGKIRIPVGGLSRVEEARGLFSTLVHEMTHAFLHRMAPAGLPRWFHEGLAKTAEGYDPAKIREQFSKHPPQGFASLNDVDRGLEGRGGDVMAAYLAARLAVADMEELRGFNAVRRIIAAVGAGQPFAEAFRDEMRLELPEFEERWRRDLG